ncbi:hypothetical protein [Paraburkholderia largidicola]|uniref:Uncharacterized protein n=1 Tax=Paraburkholderia largidicola TaxID=3014751 RepID=A0A7I8C276_9BURK|nr:hypothetical protein [Paraburkholderia sp. PGU16]BCF95142.1 hypothetical protein PPGU16_82090 [Paraburkholderia sp. PGU16]
MKNEKKSSALRPKADLARREDDLIALSDRDAVRAALADGLSGHLRIGMLFSQMMEKAIARYTAEHGDSRQNRQHVANAIYRYIEKEFGRTRAVVLLYIRCYQRFGDGAEFSKLTFRDMVLRLSDVKPAGAA